MKKTDLFENFINENLDNVYRFAYSYTKNKEDAEDILHESVVKAIRSLNSLKNADNIKPWFYKIVANTALNSIKAKSKIVYLEYEDMEPLQISEDDYSKLNFMELIEKLEPKYKSIIILRYFENMTIAQVAEVLNINENTVKTRLYKALKALRMNAEEVY